MAWIGNELKQDIYSDLYFNGNRLYNAGLLNLVNLADRTEEERRAIAKQGNAESLKARRIKKGIRLTKRFAYYEQRYFKDPVVLKDEGGQTLTQKEENHIIALNNKYDRLQQAYEQIKEQLSELYGVDVLEVTQQRLLDEYNGALWLARKYKTY